MALNTEAIVLKLAGALLVRHGELSIRDIRAMPFFTSPDQAEPVIDYLIRTFDAEVYSKRVASQPLPEWEQVIRLRKSHALAALGSFLRCNGFTRPAP